MLSVEHTATGCSAFTGNVTPRCQCGRWFEQITDEYGNDTGHLCCHHCDRWADETRGTLRMGIRA